MTKQRRLGRGLEALLGVPLDQDLAPEVELTDDGSPSTIPIRPDAVAEGKSSKSYAPIDGQIAELNVYEIDNNPFQPRRSFHPDEIASLADSIKRHRQLQPIIVRKSGLRFQLISGERRLRAAIHAGLETIRAVIHDADDRLTAELALVENLQRKDLNGIEKATSFKNYISTHNCTQDELAKRLSIDRSTIANLIRLLELPEEIQLAVQQERLSPGHARALLPLGEEQLQNEVATTIQAEGWTVRATELWVQSHLRAEDAQDAEISRTADSASPKALRGTKTTSHQIGALEQEFRMSLGTKVDIRQTAKGRGRIVVHFTSEDEFERLREFLCPPEFGDERNAA